MVAVAAERVNMDRLLLVLLAWVTVLGGVASALLWMWVSSTTQNRILAGLLAIVVGVSTLGLWRCTKENPSQPHVPTKRAVPRVS